MRVWSLGREDPLEKEMATLSSILAWRIPWTEEPAGLQSMGWQRVGHDWVTNTHTYIHTYYFSGCVESYEEEETFFKTLSHCLIFIQYFWTFFLLWSPFCRIFLLQLTCSLALEWSEVGKISPGWHPDHSCLPLKMICFYKNILIITMQKNCHCSSFHANMI